VVYQRGEKNKRGKRKSGKVRKEREEKRRRRIQALTMMCQSMLYLNMRKRSELASLSPQ